MILDPGCVEGSAISKSPVLGPELSSLKSNNVSIFIGPEGDFTKEEVEQAQLNQFNSIKIGNERLRTETAGLMACSFMYWYNTNTQIKT